jgi:hypothetical protein
MYYPVTGKGIAIGFSNEAAHNDGANYISEGVKRPILCYIFLASETITLDLGMAHLENCSHIVSGGGGEAIQR